MKTQPPASMTGPVYAVRTFCLRTDGALLPLNNGAMLRLPWRRGDLTTPDPFLAPWVAGMNVAACSHDRPHRAPAPGCSCGFYAYGSLTALDTSAYLTRRHVVAVISCEGTVIPGRRGLRAEKATITAVWLSEQCGPELTAKVAATYPGAAVYRNQKAMLAEHPTTRLPAYRLPRTDRPWAHPARFAAALTYFIALVALFLYMAATSPGHPAATPPPTPGWLIALDSATLLVALLPIMAVLRPGWWPAAMTIPPVLLAATYTCAYLGANDTALWLFILDIGAAAPLAVLATGFPLMHRLPIPITRGTLVTSPDGLPDLR